jgi:serine/threonine protein kinase
MSPPTPTTATAPAPSAALVAPLAIVGVLLVAAAAGAAGWHLAKRHFARQQRQQHREQLAAAASLLQQQDGEAVGVAAAAAAPSAPALLLATTQQQHADVSIRSVNTTTHNNNNNHGAHPPLVRPGAPADAVLFCADAEAASAAAGAARRGVLGTGRGDLSVDPRALIGRGTFGKVHAGVWRGALVAVKTTVFPASELSGPQRRRRMAVVETLISSSLAHPNVVQTYTYYLRPLLAGEDHQHQQMQQQKQQKHKNKHKQVRLAEAPLPSPSPSPSPSPLAGAGGCTLAAAAAAASSSSALQQLPAPAWARKPRQRRRSHMLAQLAAGIGGPEAAAAAAAAMRAEEERYEQRLRRRQQQAMQQQEQEELKQQQEQQQQQQQQEEEFDFGCGSGDADGDNNSACRRGKDCSCGTVGRQSNDDSEAVEAANDSSISTGPQQQQEEQQQQQQQHKRRHQQRSKAAATASSSSSPAVSATLWEVPPRLRQLSESVLVLDGTTTVRAAIQIDEDDDEESAPVTPPAAAAAAAAALTQQQPHPLARQPSSSSSTTSDSSSGADQGGKGDGGGTSGDDEDQLEQEEAEAWWAAEADAAALFLGGDAAAAAQAAACGGTTSSAPVVSRWEVRLVLEFCDRGSLRDHLSQPGAFELPAIDAEAAADNAAALAAAAAPSTPTRRDVLAVLDTALEIAQAMVHLHSEGIVHADLKARNILLKSSTGPTSTTGLGNGNGHGGNGNGACCLATVGNGSAPPLGGRRGFTAKVGDFGLSVRLLPGEECHAQPLFQGTLPFMAPEVLRSGRISRASDVYAFGVLLWELWTGEHAHRGVPRSRLASEVAQRGLRPQFPGDAPFEYVLLACRCWEGDPSLRPGFPAIVADLRRMRARAERGERAQARALADARALAAARRAEAAALAAAAAGLKGGCLGCPYLPAGTLVCPLGRTAGFEAPMGGGAGAVPPPPPDKDASVSAPLHSLAAGGEPGSVGGLSAPEGQRLKPCCLSRRASHTMAFPSSDSTSLALLEQDAGQLQQQQQEQEQGEAFQALPGCPRAAGLPSALCDEPLVPLDPSFLATAAPAISGGNVL